jgi:hypothetical protein
MRHRFVAVRLSEQERLAMNEIAKRWGCPRSDVLRWSFRAILIKDVLPDQPSDVFHPTNESGFPLHSDK